MKTRITRALLAGALVLGGLAACSSITSPSHVGLYYNWGPWEGNEFAKCTTPSGTDTYPVNDDIFYVPIDGRTWLIDEADGSDSKEVTVVTAKPEPGQTTGAAVKIGSQTSFMLNSYCGEKNDDKGSPLVQWWEKYGRGYGADVNPDLSAAEQRADEGWVTMLRQVLVPALNTAIKDTAKNYPASALVSGAANGPMMVDGVQREGLRAEIGKALASELKRLTGGEYFCGPTFSRASSVCPQAEVTTQAEYASAELLNAQAEKQAAIERSNARVIEAQGKVKAAEEEAKLYNNPNWLALEMARLELEEAKALAEACKNAAQCTIVGGQVTPVASVN